MNVQKSTEQDASAQADSQTRRNYLKDCWERSSQHRFVAFILFVTAFYGILTSWIFPFVELPAISFFHFNLPKLPLVWAAVLFSFGLLFVVFEGGYRLHETTVFKHSEKIKELHRQAENTIGAREWKDLSDRFVGIESAIRADWFRDVGGSESWRICGGFAEKCESLCRLGGAMLARSPKVCDGLSMEIRGENDLIVKWLRFIKDLGVGRMENMMHGVATGPNGKESGVYLAGSINNLGRACSVACLECAAKEA